LLEESNRRKKPLKKRKRRQNQKIIFETNKYALNEETRNDRDKMAEDNI